MVVKGGSQTSELEWVGGLVQVPAYATGDGTPYRPEALFWLDATGAVRAAQVGKPGELLLLAAEILEQTIDRLCADGALGPTRVRVGSPLLAATLRNALPTLEIVCAATPEVEALVDAMREQFAEDAIAEQTYLAGEADVDSMAALFAAAAELYRAAPWRRRVPEHACVFVTIKQLDLNDAVLAFTGELGHSPGVVLLASLADHVTYRAALPLLARGERPVLPRQLALNFERGAELSAGQRKEIFTHRWEVASPDAYPWLVVLDEDLVARAPVPDEIALAEALARALSMLVTEHGAELYAALCGGVPLLRELEVNTRRGQLTVAVAAPQVPGDAPTDFRVQGGLAANTGIASPLTVHRTQQP